jgi:RNA polymerase sigma-70 factor (ECF subfamily)
LSQGGDLLNESQLIRRCQRGDAAAFEALFDQYSRNVLQKAYLMTGNRAAAEDILQEAFTQTFRAIDQLKEPLAFSSWLYRITVRAARKYMHRESTVQHTEARAASDWKVSEPAPDHKIVNRQLVWAAIEKLPEHYRVVVVLHYFDDRSVAEIADIMEAPTGTVKSWLHRARAALAAELGHDAASIGGDESHG